MKLVIDATELFEEPFLESPQWASVESYLCKYGAQLVVPEVVVEEAVRHFSRKVEKALRAVGQLNKLLRTKISWDEVEIDASVYRERLLKRLKDLGALVSKHSTIPMENVVRRSIDGKKPFDSEGHKGFRDSLIWEAVLETARGDEVAFITRNTKDFCADGDLTGELKAEVQALDNGDARVQVFVGVREFNERLAKPALEKVIDYQNKLEEGALGYFDVSRFLSQIQGEVQTELEEHIPHSGILQGFVDVERAHLAILSERPTSLRFGDVRRLGGGLIAFSITASYACEVVVDVWEYEGRSEPPSGWSLESRGVGEAIVEVILDEDGGELRSWEVAEVSITLDGEE